MRFRSVERTGPEFLRFWPRPLKLIGPNDLGYYNIITIPNKCEALIEIVEGICIFKSMYIHHKTTNTFTCILTTKPAYDLLKRPIYPLVSITVYVYFIQGVAFTYLLTMTPCSDLLVSFPEYVTVSSTTTFCNPHEVVA